MKKQQYIYIYTYIHVVIQSGLTLKTFQMYRKEGRFGRLGRSAFGKVWRVRPLCFGKVWRVRPVSLQNSLT